jgi:hypothetical protein
VSTERKAFLVSYILVLCHLHRIKVAVLSPVTVSLLVWSELFRQGRSGRSLSGSIVLRPGTSSFLPPPCTIICGGLKTMGYLMGRKYRKIQVGSWSFRLVGEILWRNMWHIPFVELNVVLFHDCLGLRSIYTILYCGRENTLKMEVLSSNEALVYEKVTETYPRTSEGTTVWDLNICTVQSQHLVILRNTVELGYNVMKGTEYFVSL